MKRVTTLVMTMLLLMAAPFGGAVQAQEQQPTVSKQEQARVKFQELTERMNKLMATLQSTAPEDSKVIAAGLRFVQEAKIHEDMAHIRQMLGQEKWDEALSEMQEVRKDLSKLLDLLQNRNTDLAKLLEQIQRLQAFRDRVDQLSKEQGKEKEDSAKTEELQKHLANLEAAKQRAENLLAQQKDVREQTNQLGVQAAAEAAKPLEDKEGQLKDDTEKLAKDLEALDKKDAELKENAAKAGQPSEAKPSDSKPSEAKPGEGSCSGKAGQASKAMGQAQKQLGDKKPESALKDQDQAIEKLKEAVKDLEAMAETARRELEKLPFELQAKKQEQTQQATDTLSKDMEKSEENGDNGEGKQTPGRKRVQQAVPKQKAAAGQLKEYKPAKQKQQDAKEDLDQAKQELDEALAQLRQQLQDEVLRALEERFTAMLAKQRELSAQTKHLDRTRGNVLTADGSLPTDLVNKIQNVASGESDLEVEASDALKLLEEEGTTAVFPEIVQELQSQLRGVAKRCRGNETGKPTQEGQAEVEDTLTLLINALRKTIELKDGGGQCGSCNGQPQLVPISAELKMIRFLQERVNKRTKDLDGIPAALKETDDAKAEAAELSSRQGKVQDLTRKLANKLNHENHAGEGGR